LVSAGLGLITIQKDLNTPKHPTQTKTQHQKTKKKKKKTQKKKRVKNPHNNSTNKHHVPLDDEHTTKKTKKWGVVIVILAEGVWAQQWWVRMGVKKGAPRTGKKTSLGPPETA